MSQLTEALRTTAMQWRAANQGEPREFGKNRTLRFSGQS